MDLCGACVPIKCIKCGSSIIAPVLWILYVDGKTTSIAAYKASRVARSNCVFVVVVTAQYAVKLVESVDIKYKHPLCAPALLIFVIVVVSCD